MPHGDVEKHTEEAEAFIAQAEREREADINLGVYLAQLGIATALLALADAVGKKKKDG